MTTPTQKISLDVITRLVIHAEKEAVRLSRACPERRQDLYKALRDRVHRGVALAEKGAVRKSAIRGAFLVRSENGTGEYRVSKLSGVTSCECPDHERGRQNTNQYGPWQEWGAPDGRCKHIAAVNAILLAQHLAKAEAEAQTLEAAE